jgi:hypothetical protein
VDSATDQALLHGLPADKPGPRGLGPAFLVVGVFLGIAADRLIVAFPRILNAPRPEAALAAH